MEEKKIETTILRYRKISTGPGMVCRQMELWRNIRGKNVDCIPRPNGKRNKGSKEILNQSEVGIQTKKN